VSDVKKSHMILNINLDFTAVDSAGKTLSEGKIKERVTVIKKSVTDSGFDHGVKIKAYLNQCKSETKENEKQR
jgi:hypothetical protein